LATAVSVFANGGYLMKPYIVQTVTNKKGRVLEHFTPQKVRRVISEKTADIIKNMMKSVLETGGTGKNAVLFGYSAGGKTGTAQKVGRSGTYERGKYVASFVGFAPVKKPAITVLVIVDEPKGKHYGGTVAAPAFRKIAQETLIYLNVLPDKNTEKLTAQLAKEVTG
jgi:cell division protein FtsI (penicillin-binding protein 3)